MYISKWFGIFFSVVFCATIFAQEIEQPTYEIKQSGYSLDRPFLIAISDESYPYHFIDENNQPAGIMVDFWNLWAELQQVEVKYQTLNWPDSIEAVEKNNVDFHAGMGFNAARASRFTFSEPIIYHNSYVYIQRDMPIVESVDDLLPFTIGVVRGSSHIDTLNKQNPLIKLRIYSSRNAMFDAALAGEVNAFTSVEILEKEYHRFAEIKEYFPNYRRFAYFTGEYGSALDKKNGALKAFIDQGINKISQKQRSNFYNKWISASRKSNVLNLVYTSNLSPYMGTSPSGKPQGLFVDIWRLWSETTGIDVEFTPETMSGSVQMLHKKQADVHIGYPEKAPTTTGLKIASHVYSVKSQVFVNKRVGNVHNMEGLFGKNIGLFKTAPYLTLFKTMYPQINVFEYVNHDQMIQAAENNIIDAMISERENMNVKLVNANLQSSFYVLFAPAFNSELFSLVNPDNTQLAQVISEGFDKISIEQLREIERNWVAFPEEGYFSQHKENLNFSVEEFEFLSEHKEIIVGINRNWAPIEFENIDGQADGINKDMITLVSELAGFKVKFVTFDSFDALYRAFINKEIDLIAALTESQNRINKFIFTQGYWSMPWAILHNKFLDVPPQISYFYGKELAVIKGYELISVLRLKHPQINIRVVDNIEEGLLAVQQGLVEGFIDTLPVVSKLAKRENITPMSVSIIDELPDEFSKMMVHRENYLLASIINKSLAAMSDESRQDIFDKWFDITINTGLDRRFVTKVAMQAGVLIFIIFLVIAFWNRKLIKEIKLRKKLEAKMKHMATHDELTGVANRVLLKQQISQAIAIHQRQQLKLAVLFVDLDGFKKVNDSFGHDTGDKVLQEVATRLNKCVRQSDTVARFGGDEFVVLLTGLHDKKESTYVAEKIISSINVPYFIGADTAHIGCSIGIGIYPDDASTDSGILNVADNLMYKVKTTGKNNYTLYSE